MTAPAIDYSRTAAKRTPLTMAFWVGLYIAMIPFVNWSFTWAPNWRLYGDFKFNPVTIVTGLVLVVRDFAQRQVGHSIFFAMLVALLFTVLLASLMLVIVLILPMLLAPLALLLLVLMVLPALLMQLLLLLLLCSCCCCCWQ
jgi:hypothetical protein